MGRLFDPAPAQFVEPRQITAANAGQLSSSYERKTALDEEWENRVLCSDGSCIGVIGADGRCKECGKPYEGPLPENVGRPLSTAAPAPPSEPESKTDEPQPPAVAEADRAKPPADGDEWENRVLCSDGNCIGVIGADGRCKECGKPYAPDSTE
jgi:hypothetical protein